MTKKFVPEVSEDGVEYRCKHERVWPPIEAFVYGPTAQHSRYKVADRKYQQIRTWEQVCGLLKMDLTKCAACPHVVANGVSESEARSAASTVHHPRLNALRKQRRMEKRGKDDG